MYATPKEHASVSGKLRSERHQMKQPPIDGVRGGE